MTAFLNLYHFPSGIPAWDRLPLISSSSLVWNSRQNLWDWRHSVLKESQNFFTVVVLWEYVIFESCSNKPTDSWAICTLHRPSRENNFVITLVGDDIIYELPLFWLWVHWSCFAISACLNIVLIIKGPWSAYLPIRSKPLRLISLVSHTSIRPFHECYSCQLWH